MNKEQFIAYMNKKLSIIKEEERKDIIDEYINHIEMKEAEGFREEETIAGFGDIDEMIKEILDAYNIDSKKQYNDFDYKINDFLDRLFEAFKRLFSGMDTMNADRLVRLVFEILLVLILLGLLRIPFSIIGSVGSRILRGIFGYGIGSSFAWIFKVLVNLVYLVVFIVVMVNIVRRRWYHVGNTSNKDIMDDFKESFNFQQAKEAVYRFTQGSEHSQDGPYREDFTSEDDLEEEIKRQCAQEEQQERKKDSRYEGPNYDSRYQRRADDRQYREETTSILRTILKVFGYLLMTPFIFIMIGLCCALGFVVIMSLQGVTIIGVYFLLIGGIVGIGSVINLIERFLCKGGKW